MYKLATLISIILLGSTAMALDHPPRSTEVAVFGGGCFWCMQPSFDNTPGVISTSVGYTGGEAKTANYDAVSTGTTGHVEVIQVTYDPAKVSYAKLLSTYLENIDPTDPDGQFADKGSQYLAAIYYENATQHQAAVKALQRVALKFSPTPIVVKIKPATSFYAAEDYHQKYYLKNKTHYNAYKYGSGRAAFIEEHWQKQG